MQKIVAIQASFIEDVPPRNASPNGTILKYLVTSVAITSSAPFHSYGGCYSQLTLLTDGYTHATLDGPSNKKTAAVAAVAAVACWIFLARARRARIESPRRLM